MRLCKLKLLGWLLGTEDSGLGPEICDECNFLLVSWEQKTLVWFQVYAKGELLAASYRKTELFNSCIQELKSSDFQKPASCGEGGGGGRGALGAAWPQLWSTSPLSLQGRKASVYWSNALAAMCDRNDVCRLLMFSTIPAAAVIARNSQLSSSIPVSAIYSPSGQVV